MLQSKHLRGASVPPSYSHVNGHNVYMYMYIINTYLITPLEMLVTPYRRLILHGNSEWFDVCQMTHTVL